MCSGIFSYFEFVKAVASLRVVDKARHCKWNPTRPERHPVIHRLGEIQDLAKRHCLR